MLRLLASWLVLATVTAYAGTGGEAGRYLETGDYIRVAFGSNVPEPQVLWVSGELRNTVERVLGHRFESLRVRYWYDGARSLWVLDEIGKELPITIGVTVERGAIADVSVLEFRESRGWEVRYPFFTNQFANARLTPDSKLDRKIDGITGATLSVGAVTRIARVALILHDNVHAAAG